MTFEEHRCSLTETASSHGSARCSWEVSADCGEPARSDGRSGGFRGHRRPCNLTLWQTGASDGPGVITLAMMMQCHFHGADADADVILSAQLLPCRSFVP